MYTKIPSTKSAFISNLRSQPLSIAIYSSISSFNYYKSGIYTDTNCVNKNTVDHAVTAIGYGVDATYGEYAILQNQWGTYWGDQGYIRF